MSVPVDGEPLELVEDREARRGDLVPPVDAAERDHVDRRLLRLHDVDLRRRRLRAEQPLRVEEERVAGRARRVRGREGELVEVVVDGLDLAVVDDLVAEPEEGVLDDPARQRRRMERARGALLAGQRDVDDVLGRAGGRARRARSCRPRARRPPPRGARGARSAPSRSRGRGRRGARASSSLLRPRNSTRTCSTSSRLGRPRRRRARRCSNACRVHGGDCSERSLHFGHRSSFARTRDRDSPGRDGNDEATRAPRPRLRAGAP